MANCLQCFLLYEGTLMNKRLYVLVEKLVNPKRKIIVVDGVGFPAVGSIVGVSNAVVAKALNSPVLVVCPKGKVFACWK